MEIEKINITELNEAPYNPREMQTKEMEENKKLWGQFSKKENENLTNKKMSFF